MLLLALTLPEHWSAACTCASCACGLGPCALPALSTPVAQLKAIMCRLYDAFHEPFRKVVKAPEDNAEAAHEQVRP